VVAKGAQNRHFFRPLVGSPEGTGTQKKKRKAKFDLGQQAAVLGEKKGTKGRLGKKLAKAQENRDRTFPTSPQNRKKTRSRVSSNKTSSVVLPDLNRTEKQRRGLGNFDHYWKKTCRRIKTGPRDLVSQRVASNA